MQFLQNGVELQIIWKLALCEKLLRPLSVKPLGGDVGLPS